MLDVARSDDCFYDCLETSIAEWPPSPAQQRKGARGPHLDAYRLIHVQVRHALGRSHRADSGMPVTRPCTQDDVKAQMDAQAWSFPEAWTSKPRLTNKWLAPDRALRIKTFLQFCFAFLSCQHQR